MASDARDDASPFDVDPQDRIVEPPVQSQEYFCRHCQEPVNKLRQGSYRCPGCLRLVCVECYQSRKLRVNQSCRG